MFVFLQLGTIMSFIAISYPQSSKHCQVKNMYKFEQISKKSANQTFFLKYIVSFAKQLLWRPVLVNDYHAGAPKHAKANLGLQSSQTNL